MKLTHPAVIKSAGLAAARLIRGWMSTLDYKAAFYDASVDPVLPDQRTPRIWIFWHEYILIPLHMRGYCNLAMLLSKHRDADILYELGSRMGFEMVRGSTFNGSSAAMLELLDRAAHERRDHA